MNKAQFIEALAERLDIDRRAAQTNLDAVLDTIYANVSKGERVVLTGFGIFEKRERAARTARNPATGAQVKVKKTSVPGFKAGTEFKAITSGAKKLAKAPVRKASSTVAAAKKAVSPAKASATKASPAKATATKASATKASPAKASKAASKAAPAKKAVKAVKASTPAKSAATKTAAKTPAKKAPAKKAATRSR